MRKKIQHTHIFSAWFTKQAQLGNIISRIYISISKIATVWTAKVLAIPITNRFTNIAGFAGILRINHNNMKNKWEEIGIVGVDSGQLLICDPGYIDSEWENRDYEDRHRVVSKKTGNVYWYGKDFRHYEEILEGKTVNQHLKKKSFEEVEDENLEDSDFNYNSICHSYDDKRYTQCKYKMGHPGVGVAFQSGYGDGVYPVYTRKNKEGRIVEVRIVME